MYPEQAAVMEHRIIRMAQDHTPMAPNQDIITRNDGKNSTVGKRTNERKENHKNYAEGFVSPARSEADANLQSR